jgi:hypothetical protein
MRKGAALHCTFGGGTAVWWLSGGYHVSAEVVRIIAIDPNVVAVDLPLFAGSPPQTLRWCDFSNKG